MNGASNMKNTKKIKNYPKELDCIDLKTGKWRTLTMLDQMFIDLCVLLEEIKNGNQIDDKDAECFITDNEKLSISEVLLRMEKATKDLALTSLDTKNMLNERKCTNIGKESSLISYPINDYECSILVGLIICLYKKVDNSNQLLFDYIAKQLLNNLV